MRHALYQILLTPPSRDSKPINPTDYSLWLQSWERPLSLVTSYNHALYTNVLTTLISNAPFRKAFTFHTRDFH